MTCILWKQELHRLFDGDIDRPPTTSPHAARWEKASTDIQAWLFQAVPEGINRLAFAFRLRCAYADEYIEALKQTLKKNAYVAVSRDCAKIWNIRRNQHSTGSEFMEAFRKQYVKLDLRVTVPPFFLSQVVMHEVRYEDPTMVSVGGAFYAKP